MGDSTRNPHHCLGGPYAIQKWWIGTWVRIGAQWRLKPHPVPPATAGMGCCGYNSTEQAKSTGDSKWSVVRIPPATTLYVAMLLLSTPETMVGLLCVHGGHGVVLAVHDCLQHGRAG